MTVAAGAIQRGNSTSIGREMWSALFTVANGQANGTLYYEGRHMKEFSVALRTEGGDFDVSIGGGSTKLRFKAELPAEERRSGTRPSRFRSSTKARIAAIFPSKRAVRDKGDS